MEFDEILTRVIELLQRQGRISYGALKRRFHIDDEYLTDLKDELINAQRVAGDEDGKVLVWNGAGRPAAPVMHTPPASLPPASYTPPYLAERTRAEQSAMELRGSADGERKTITALFADLKGSTALIEGLDALAEALEAVDRTGARAHEAELYRLKGQLILQSQVQGPRSKVEKDAEGCFLKAIEIARNQQAKSLELCTVMSLVRLRQLQVQNHTPRTTQHGSHTTQHETRTKLDEAHIMLSEIPGWFTEGFDTKDLQEAKTLLGELNR